MQKQLRICHLLRKHEADVNIISRKDAKAKGLMFYFTGRPCKRGHISSRLVSSEMCRECAAIGSKRWHKENRAKAIRSMRDNYNANRESRLEYAHTYYKNNAIRLREKAGIYRTNNAPKVLESSRRYHLKHKERRNLESRLWFKNNPDKARVRRRNYYARKRNAEGTHTTQDILDIFKQQRMKCAYCRSDLSKQKFHVDHIVPLVKKGRNDRTNLQILCGLCNTRKQARDPIVHARSLGLLL